MKRRDIAVEPCERCGQQHARPFTGAPTCTAHKQRKTVAVPLMPCLGGRMPGLTTCRVHCGSTDRGRKAAAGRAAEKVLGAEVAKTLQVFGWRREVDPAQGLIESYWRSAALVERYEALIAELLPDDLGFGIITEKTKRTSTVIVDDEDGSTSEIPLEEKTVTRGGRKHILVRYYDEERDRFAKLGIEIVKLGLEARRDEYIRAQVGVFAGILDGLDLTLAQRQKAAQIMRGLAAPVTIDAAPPAAADKEPGRPRLVRVVDGVIVGELS